MSGSTRKSDLSFVALFFRLFCSVVTLVVIFTFRYYLKYQNPRVEYISAFWNVANFDNCVKLYDAARKQ